LMVVTTTLVAPTNISPNRDCTADENRSCWIRTYLSALPHYRARLPALPRYLPGLVLTPFVPFHPWVPSAASFPTATVVLAPVASPAPVSTALRD
jgi:hypothetical protein